MKHIIIIFFLFISLITNAQRVITGQVFDEIYNEIPGTLVKVCNTDIAVMTNNQGLFSLQVPNEISKIYLKISMSGLEDTTILIFTNDSIFYFKMKYSHKAIKKPIIYLYPTKETDIKIDINFSGQIENTYPLYEKGWQVTAKPNGDLINKKDNTKHRYLFWDGTLNKDIKISDFETGFVVKGAETVNFLDSILTLVGLNDYEKNDFITYWSPIMKQNKYNFVYFMINNDCNQISMLDVNPGPNTEIRVYMFFSKVNSNFEIKKQKLNKTERKGFVMVEWGGMNLDGRKIE
jgi:hypothetical protein